jgi:hypothetical protein
MFETMASFIWVEHANGAMFDPRWGGYLAVLIYNDRHWSAFVNAAQPPWASDLGADAAQASV